LTWGRKNGDAGNCGFYAPLCTYAGMQARLRESYLQMTIDNNATVAPVGMAWKRIIDTQPAINLYNADESHPVETGSYLAACVFYSSLFHKPSYNCPYTFTLADSIANKLQLAADFTVFDSLAQWQENGKLITPKFNYTVNNALVTFNQLSTGSDSYNWDFGNGSTASGSNVQHTYTQPGEYVVTLTAYNNCRSATITDTVVVEVNQPNSLSGLFNKDIQVYPTNFDKGFLVECHESNLSIEVYTINGKLLLHKNLLQETTLVPLNDIAAQPLLYRITKNMHAVKTGRLQKL
jgi:hypothetical protein